MNKLIRIILASAVILAASCTPEDKPAGGGADNEGTASSERTFFAKGADISWVTQMEADGLRFYNRNGEERECTMLMKEIGMNSIRLRVWVNPKGGWCGEEDVLAKARRAQALGMKIMIDFHYSDSWADPGKQVTPAAWSSYGTEQLIKAVEDHTTDILKALKNNGVNVEWVQIGNEVDSGMLHPAGQIAGDSASGFAKLFNAGAKAAKDVFPDSKIILHISNGHDSGLYTWYFGLMKAFGVKYDMIGMSIYPTWWENNGWKAWETNAGKCIDNIGAVAKAFGKPVMICETGMPADEVQMSGEAMQYLLTEAAKIKECHGVFYWEPEVYGGWKPADYADLGWSSYGMGAFDSNGRPTAALDPFKN